MEITLEKIELVKDRTGVSYREAKSALEEANGSVVDAIIFIEENIGTEDSDADNLYGNELSLVLKRLLKKGICHVSSLRRAMKCSLIYRLQLVF